MLELLVLSVVWHIASRFCKLGNKDRGDFPNAKIVQQNAMINFLFFCVNKCVCGNKPIYLPRTSSRTVSRMAVASNTKGVGTECSRNAAPKCLIKRSKCPSLIPISDKRL